MGFYIKNQIIGGDIAFFLGIFAGAVEIAQKLWYLETKPSAAHYPEFHVNSGRIIEKD